MHSHAARRAFAKAGFTAMALSAILSHTAFAAQTTYRVTDLGAIVAGGTSVALDINNSGQVAGASSIGGSERVTAVWSNGTVTKASSTPVIWSAGFAINDAGTVVGSFDAGNGQQAGLWSNGQLTTLPWARCCSSSSAIAYDINNQGVVAGSDDYKAVTWSNGMVQVLPHLSPNYGSYAIGINDRGWVVGGSVSTAEFLPATHAVIWRDGQVIDLGVAAGFKESSAESVNYAGDVVGYSNDGSYDSRTHATLWRNGQVIDLGTLNGTDATFATDISSSGQIIGYSMADPAVWNSALTALIWTKDLAPVALNSLIDPLDALYGRVTFSTASGINDRGQIVGYGLFEGQVRAYLLTPSAVPEAGALGYALAGGAVIAAMVKRRRQVRFLG